ncbi:MFS transporter [Paraflavitalea soli]|uniref:MFS transporter n=1 Tax=Paraflavitalea soli TaxID=2315862 RepID=A0A3B7MWM0_9BACT|nr:MFS transporter [Paraflavitalea soli]AXY77396.1 MFS transporter [Paraflavitalea soli]
MQTASKKVINGWAMYDWANSVYNLVITTTFFPIYFNAATKDHFKSDEISFLGRKFVNSALYDYAIAAAYLVIALLYPLLTSIADTRGNKKGFMQFFCYMGAIGCSALYFFNGANVEFGIFFFILAAIGYCGSLVFYNSYLPEIAAEQDRDRISARGYSFGYVGSVLLQIIGFVLVIVLPSAGLASRITFLLTGLWWLGFAQITFRVLPVSVPSIEKHTAGVFKESFSEIKKVYGQVKLMPVLKRFLRGFFFYSMGVQTVMLAATMFGSKMLGLNETKLIITVVIIQLVAIIGAWGMSRLSAVYGNLKVLMGVVILWIVICVAAYYTAVLKENGVDPEFHFYGLAIAVGLVMGGIQSLSRSTYSKLMPETKDTASFFSYYDLTEKIAIVIGIFSFGLIEELTGSMKTSVLSLIVFFAIGLIWLYSALYRQNRQKVT